jgi:hypothetical protein
MRPLCHREPRPVLIFPVPHLWHFRRSPPSLRSPHHHEAGHLKAAHQTVGRDPGHLVICLPPLLSAIKEEGDRERLAQVVRVSGTKGIIWYLDSIGGTKQAPVSEGGPPWSAPTHQGAAGI